jgi:hypothetical protein
VSGSRQRGTCAESRSTWLSAKNYWGASEVAQHHNPHGPNLAHDPASRCWPSIVRSTTHSALLSPPSQTLVYMAVPFPALHHPQPTPPPPFAHLASLLSLHRRPVHTPPSGATPPAQPRRPPPPPSAHPSPRGEEQRRGEARWRRIRPASAASLPARFPGGLPARIRWWCGGFLPGADPVVHRLLPA